MKLDFNTPLLDLKEKIVKNPDGSEVLLNELLANGLVATTGKENIIKIFDWALAIQKTGILELDRTDQDLLKRTIENSDNFSVLGKGRLLGILEKKQPEKVK